MGKTKHGGCGTRLYSIWKDMRRRCNNENRKQYCDYGGRGITVCEEWNDFEAFRNWALRNGYTDQLTIDRKDNDGNYEPSNCRWVTPSVQNLNTRQNANVEIDGVTKTVTEWARENGLNVRSVLWRYEQGIRGKELIGPLKVSMTGQHHSEDVKRRISEGMKGENAPWYGKKRPQETRDKMSAGMKGRTPYNKTVFSDEILINIKEDLKTNSVQFVAIKYGFSWRAIDRLKRQLRG